MPTADLASRQSFRRVWGRLVVATAVLLLAGAVASTGSAHPVAQGAMDFQFEPTRIVLKARVAPEEVLVALAYATDPGAPAPPPTPAADVWGAHGPYLLSHLRVSVDGQPLTGRYLGVEPPPDAGVEARAVYTLEYPLAGPAPTRLRVEQDVLREFTYAPGNPWTASYSVRVEAPGGAPPVAGLLLAREQPLDLSLLTSPEEKPVPSGSAPAIRHGQVMREYVVHGLWHILTGYDHMLFMGALVLAARTLWDLVKVVSVFTLAHTLTLTLSVLNLVRLPSAVVEPMIASSIVFVAVQNMFFPSRSRGVTRLLAAFGFGLFHGLGFAGGLLEAMSGLPTLAIGTAIASFSLGVELGHQAVVLPVFGGLKLVERFRRQAGPRAVAGLRRQVELAGSAVVALAGTGYLFLALRGA